MNIELLHPDRLSPEQLALWDRIQKSEPALDSPYFRPEFTQQVARVRRDVEVALLRDEKQIIGFFPFQRGLLNLGKPVGGKVSDYHGVIAPAGTQVDPLELIRGCRLSGWDFDHLVTNLPTFEPFCAHATGSPFIDLSAGFEAYAQERRAAGSDELRRIGQKMRKCERERGPLTLEFDCQDESVLQTLMNWKSAQLKQSGFADIFAFPWTVSLLKNILRESSTDFSALMNVLRLGDRPVAMLYSMRSGPVLHSWIFAYDRELAAYSPGSILLLKVLEQLNTAGITKFDFGKGDERYKASLANRTAPLWEGTVNCGGPGIWLLGSWRRTRDWLSNSGLGRASALPLKVLKPLREWFAHS